MRRVVIFTLLAMLVMIVPVQAQKAECDTQTVITSFAQATDIGAWMQQFSTCPSNVRRAVHEMASAYQLLQSEFLPFAAADNSFEFGSIWQWYQGSSGSLVYNIDTTNNILTLLADSMTEQRDAITTAPVLAYPVNGDVTAQVKLTIDTLDELHGAGIGIRAAQDPTSWVRLARVGDNVEVVIDTAGTSTSVASLPFDGDRDAYLRIERIGTSFNFSYSVNGDEWRTVASNVIAALPQESQVFLTIFWPVENGAAAAYFSEMRVNEK